MAPRLLPLLAVVFASPAGAQVASVEVTPGAATLIAGSGIQLTAVARDAAGRPVSGALVTWSVVPFDVAGVDSTGRLTARRQGEATVTVAVADRRGTARVRVEPKSAALVDLTAPREEIVVGGSLVLQATARTEDGEPLADAVFSFRSSDERVAAVDQLGVVTGRGEGTAFLVATSGEVRGEVRLRVITNRVTRLAISGPVRGRTGEVLRLRALGEDRRQLPVQGLPVGWSVSGTGASVGVTGEFVADQPGTYLVTANAGLVAASHAIRIAPRHDTRTLEAVGHLVLPGVQVTSVAVAGTTAYLTSLGNRLYTVDLRDPTSPVLADSLALPADTLHGLAVTADGTIAVVGRMGSTPEQNGLTLLDLADALHPRVLSEYGATLSSGVRAVALDGRTAYLADGTGTLRILSLADPARPLELGGWAMTDHGTGRLLRGISVRDGVVYLAYWRHGLVILDVGNGIRNGTLEKPELVSHYAYNVADWYPADRSAGAAAVLRHRNYVFLTDEVLPGAVDWASPAPIPRLGMVHVLDVTNLTAPVRLAEWRLPERGAGGLQVGGEVLYVAYGEGGLRALDVGGELRGDLAAQGRELGAVWTGDPGGYRPNLPMAGAVAIGGGLVAASDVNSGLWVVRLTPARPGQ